MISGSRVLASTFPYLSMQTEITTRTRLLDDRGFLQQKGFARKPLLDYNPENVGLYPASCLNRLRLKEWDYYGITAKDFFFSVTVSHIGYAGVVFVYFIDFSRKAMVEETVITPFGRGCHLPQTSESGDILFQRKGVAISFERLPGARAIKVDWPGFDRGKGISANIVAEQPPSLESIVVATPIGRKRFYYNQKTNCMPVEGTITMGDKRYACTRKDTLATLDWGRGVWEYSSFWIWASASGYLPDGDTVGLNLGKGFGDLSHATENCFFINGNMTKLERVDISYASSDFLKAWSFASSDGKLKLVFQPFFERTARTNLLLIRSEVHQVFGEYSGTLLTDAGRKVTIQGLIGWAEEHKARW